MAESAINSIFAIRDFDCRRDSGFDSLVRLIISNPVRCHSEDIPAEAEWYRVDWQIQGLQPRIEGATGDPVSTHGVITHSTENCDPLSTMLFALYSIRSYLETCPEGQAGRLKWKDSPDDPTWGLPAFQIPTSP